LFLRQKKIKGGVSRLFSDRTKLEVVLYTTSNFVLSEKSLETPPLILFCLKNKTLKHHLLF
jgi:hypothetical protein